MSMSARKALGTLILLFGMFIYITAVVVLAAQLPQHWAFQTVFFIISGIAWIFPAKYLLRWMQRPGPA